MNCLQVAYFVLYAGNKYSVHVLNIVAMSAGNRMKTWSKYSRIARSLRQFGLVDSLVSFSRQWSAGQLRYWLCKSV